MLVSACTTNPTVRSCLLYEGKHHPFCGIQKISFRYNIAQIILSHSNTDLYLCNICVCGKLLNKIKITGTTKITVHNNTRIADPDHCTFINVCLRQHRMILNYCLGFSLQARETATIIQIDSLFYACIQKNFQLLVFTVNTRSYTALCLVEIAVTFLLYSIISLPRIIL